MCRCARNEYVVETREVGDLIVKVIFDDTGSGAENWDELREDSRGHNLKFYEGDIGTRSYSVLAPKAPFFNLDPSISPEEIEAEQAAWASECGYHYNVDYYHNCRDRAEINEILENWYFEETGYIGEVRGYFVGEKTDFASREEFDRVCAAVSAEYRHLERGEVYAYLVETADGDHLASCHGFVGEADYALAQGIEEAEYINKEAAEEAYVCGPYEAMGNGD